MNEYINNNNNELFDSNSEQIKEELKEDLENKFHGAQIIKSTLIENQGIHINNHKNEVKTYQYIEKKFPKSLTKTNNTGTSHEIPRKKIVHRGGKNEKNNNNNDNVINNENDNNVINNNNELIDDETKRNNNNLLTNENNSKPEQSGADLLNLNVKKENITNGLFKEGDVTIEEQAAKKLLKN